jgi:single-strand DNA-binding protein
MLIGNLAADPELKTTNKGTSVCNFTVITSRSTKNAAGQWESVDVTGFPCTAWGGLADAITNTFHKGDGVIVWGALAEKSWTNKQGEQRSRLELNVKEAAYRLKKGYNDNTPEIKEKSEVDPWQAPPQVLGEQSAPF